MPGHSYFNFSIEAVFLSVKDVRVISYERVSVVLSRKKILVQIIKWMRFCISAARAEINPTDEGLYLIDNHQFLVMTSNKYIVRWMPNYFYVTVEPLHVVFNFF